MGDTVADSIAEWEVFPEWESRFALGQLEPRQRFRRRRGLGEVADVVRLDLDTVRTRNESHRVGFIDRLSLGVDVDEDATIVFVAIGVVEIVGAPAGLRGQRTIEKAAAGVAGLIAATVSPATATSIVATTTTITVAPPPPPPPPPAQLG